MLAAGPNQPVPMQTLDFTPARDADIIGVYWSHVACERHPAIPHVDARFQKQARQTLYHHSTSKPAIHHVDARFHKHNTPTHTDTDTDTDTDMDRDTATDTDTRKHTHTNLRSLWLLAVHHQKLQRLCQRRGLSVLKPETSRLSKPDTRGPEIAWVPSGEMCWFPTKQSDRDCFSRRAHDKRKSLMKAENLAFPHH